MSTTSKLGADMTDEQREAIESGIAAMEKCGWTHRVPVLRALLARQPAAIDKQEAVCRVCNGHGYRTAMSATGEGAFNETCVYCKGTGKAAPLANEASKPAPSVEQIIQAHAGEAQANLDRDALKTWWKGRDAEFKNFHHALCERFDYVHDEKDWKRDQVSLIEWIAKRLAPASPSVEQDERWAPIRAITMLAGYADGSKSAEIQNAVRYTVDWLNARAASTSANVAQGSNLDVWYGPMPESNGKTNWTAILHKGDLSEGHTIDRSEYPDRVRYAADCVRYLIGERKERPWILDYDADKHSGYVANVAQGAEAVTLTAERVINESRNHFGIYPADDTNRLAFEARMQALAAPPAQAALNDDARDAARWRWFTQNYGALNLHEKFAGNTPRVFTHGLKGRSWGEITRTIDAALTAAQSASGDTK